MPLYEYKCLKCGQRTEKIEKFDGPRLKKCPKCSGKVEPMVSSPAFQFKGSGWYVTDYARKSSSSDAGSSGKSDGSPTADSSKAEKKDSKETKPTETKETDGAKNESKPKDSRKSPSSHKP